MKTARHRSDSRAADRLKIPERCPECGAGVGAEEISGTFEVSGSGDRELALRNHGILASEGEAIEWLSVLGRCRSPDCQWSHLLVLAAD